jgi:hypothetical protein
MFRHKEEKQDRNKGKEKRNTEKQIKTERKVCRHRQIHKQTKTL